MLLFYEDQLDFKDLCVSELHRGKNVVKEMYLKLGLRTRLVFVG